MNREVIEQGPFMSIPPVPPRDNEAFVEWKQAFIGGIDWEKTDGLVPVIVQSADDDRVLMEGYANKEALEVTMDEGIVCFWSRSRQQIWRKGETSGNVLTLTGLWRDCDSDVVLARAVPAGPTCHRDVDTCFDADEGVRGADEPQTFVQQVRAVDATLAARYEAAQTDLALTSWTIDKIRNPNTAIKKLGEEVLELVQAIIEQPEERVLEEFADVVNMVKLAAMSRGKVVTLEALIRKEIERNASVTVRAVTEPTQTKEQSDGNDT